MLSVSIHSLLSEPGCCGPLHFTIKREAIIVNEVKNKNEKFDSLLKSADCKLPFEKIASCFVSASYLINDPLYHEFHSNGGTEMSFLLMAIESC
jgi:hypothetical protein